jgi:hypothetical protein
MGPRAGTPDLVRSALSKFAKVQMLPYAALLVVGAVVALVVAHSVVATGSPVPRADTLSVQPSPADPRAANAFAVARLPSIAASPKSSHKPKATASPKTGASAALAGSSVPLAGGSYAGSLIVNKTGSQLTSWDETSELCTSKSWEVPDGTVSTNSSGEATLRTTGADGSCVAIVSPDGYASAVIEADIDFPAVPGKPNMIANWTSLWLTSLEGGTWPQVGELDSAEAEPDTGSNAVSYHWGTEDNPLSVSTDSYGDEMLPIESANLTPGWHVVDIVWTSGYFAVYYDGGLYTSYRSSAVTGDALQIAISTAVTPDNSSIEQALGGPPINSDSSPATIAVKYVKVWSYK